MYKFSKETPLIGYFQNQNLIKENHMYFYFDIDFVVSNTEIGKDSFSNQLYFLGECRLGFEKKEVFYLLDRNISSFVKHYSTFNEVKINFISYIENEESNLSKPNDQFDLNNGKINIFVKKETLFNILLNLNNHKKEYREKLGSLEIETFMFSTFNNKNSKDMVCICEKKWIDRGEFSKKENIILLNPDQRILNWRLNFLNIFEIKKNKGIFRNLFN